MPVGNKNTIIPGCGTHHIAIWARDWEASLKLYRDVLGMQCVAEFGPPERKIMLLDMGDGSHMELFAPTAETPAPGSDAADHPLFQHIALATTDARAATEIVRAAGYTITVEPKNVKLDTIEATIAFFEGPNGEVIEFFQTH